MHLGAHRIMVIGVRATQTPGLGRDAPTQERPGLSAVASHAMASVFHDTLQADVEQAQRVTETLKRLPPEVAAVLPYRPVQVFAMQPSQSLDALALQHAGRAAAGDATIAWRPDQRQWWRVVGELPVVRARFYRCTDASWAARCLRPRCRNHRILPLTAIIAAAVAKLNNWSRREPGARRAESPLVVRMFAFPASTL